MAHPRARPCTAALDPRRGKVEDANFALLRQFLPETRVRPARGGARAGAAGALQDAFWSGVEDE